MPFHGILTSCHQNQENGTKKSKKNSAQDSRFSSFLLWPLYPTGSNMGSKWHVSKHAEMHSETLSVQSFGSKSGGSSAKSHASVELRAKPSSSKIKLKALIVVFRLSELNSLGDIAV